MKALSAATQPEARLASTTIRPPSTAPTVGMKASRPAWMPRMNELWYADQREPDPGHGKDRKHGQELREQPALQRLADAVDDRRPSARDISPAP